MGAWNNVRFEYSVRQVSFTAKYSVYVVGFKVDLQEPILYRGYFMSDFFKSSKIIIVIVNCKNPTTCSFILESDSGERKDELSFDNYKNNFRRPEVDLLLHKMGIKIL